MSPARRRHFSAAESNCVRGSRFYAKGRNVVSLRVSLLLLIFVPYAAVAQHHAKKQEKEKAAELPAEIWHDPGDVASLDTIDGAGGKEDAPDPEATYKFVREDLKGTSPKFDVDDEQGRRWRVKMGQEPQAETAATRFLWAVGYFVDEDYYLPQIKVSGLPRLHRGRKFVSRGGIVHRVRLELRRKDIENIGEWDWFRNPFVGTRELNGLRVMMAFLNNWDVNPDNNSIYAVDGKREYVVSDVGATFGKTGNYFTRSKSRVRDYVRAPFIARETPEYVDLVMHTRPFRLLFVKRQYYADRTRWERIAKGIPRADAKWIGERLGLLSEAQIRECFQAAGYSQAEIDEYTKAVQKRIQELNAL